MTLVKNIFLSFIKKKSKGIVVFLTAACSLSVQKQRRKLCPAPVKCNTELSQLCHLYMGRSGKEFDPPSHPQG